MTQACETKEVSTRGSSAATRFVIVESAQTQGICPSAVHARRGMLRHDGAVCSSPRQRYLLFLTRTRWGGSSAHDTCRGFGMESSELVERLAEEIENASAAGDGIRARRLADLQLEVIARMSLEFAAYRPGDPLARGPLARPAPQQEQIDRLGERHQLELLRWHWDSGYAITLDHDGWRAERRDDGTILTENTAERLVRLIREDFAARPVPRQSRR